MSQNETRALLDKPNISDLLASSFHRCRFMLEGVELASSEVFSAVGFLPPIMHEADARASRIFGFSLKLIMSDSRNALFGHRATVGVNDWRLGIACLIAAQVSEEMLGMSLMEASHAEATTLDLTPIYNFYHSDRASQGAVVVPIAERILN